MGVPDSKVHGANMGPIWGRQDPGGPHVSPVNFAIWGMSPQRHKMREYLDGLVQERHNSIANALELRLSCTKPPICWILSPNILGLV